MMAEFGRRALELNDFDALLREACEHVAEGVGVEHAKVLEYCPDTDDLLVRAGVGWAENVVGQARLSAALTSPPGRAFRTARAVFIEDIRAAPEFEYSELLRRHGIVALVNVPIGTDGFMYGVLEADGDVARHFSSDDRNFLLGFANLVSAAVQRKRHDQEDLAAAIERERLLAELRGARDAAETASASKSRLLASAAHDFRQPLQSAMLSLELLERHISDPANLARLQRAIRAVAESGNTLDRWLEFSRIESGQIEPHRKPFAVALLLTELEDSFTPIAKSTGLPLRIGGCDAVVDSDPDLLREILRNIVSNALKYTKAGAVDITCRRNGQTLSIAVQDTGVGMPSDKIEAAFQEFHRLDPSHGPGHGVGLSIVRRLADLLGHHITIRSQLGEGTCVTIDVPIAE